MNSISNEYVKLLRRTIIAVFALTAFVQAQAGEPWHPPFSPQEFTQKQESFIIKDVGLSPMEAANFFPIYHKMGQEKFQINCKIGELIKRSKQPNLQEKDYADILEQIDKLQLAKVKLENSYHQKFRKALSNEKVLRVIEADSKFDRFILKQMMGQKCPGPVSMSRDSSYNKMTLPISHQQS